MSSKYAHNLNTLSVDSFKWRLPLNLVKVIDSNLLDAVIRQTVNTSTGDIISEEQIQSNSLKAQFKDYHIHFAVSNAFGNSEIVILINSKLLQENYLDGINSSNIETIYKRIMSCKIIDLSFEQFLSGNCSDIDIKKDLEVSGSDDFKRFTLELEQASKPHKKSGYGVNRFWRSDNLGIQWNDRSKSTYSHPFIKIYHKGIESIESKNKHFFESHIDTKEIRNRIRLEATIKNKEIAQKFGFTNLKLSDVLNVSQSQLNNFVKHCLLMNVEPRLPQQTPRNINKLSPTDKIIFQSLTLALSQNISFDNAIEHLLGLFGNEQQERNAKTRQRQKITALYEEQIKGELYEQKAIKTSAFFDQIGWE